MRQDVNHGSKAGKQGFGWLKSLALLPLPLFIALIIVFAYIDTSTVIEPLYLLLALNILFLTIIPFSIAYLAWRSYANSGRMSLFFIGCSMVAFGFGSLVAGFVINVPGGTNLTPAVHNTGALLGAILLGTAAIFSLQKPSRYKLAQYRALYLGLYYLAIIIFISLFAIASYENLVPPFFVQGTGSTMLRQFVLGAATILFAVSSVIFIRVSVRSASDFAYWFSLAMALITIGMCALFLQQSVGSPTGWVGRAAQYLGCAYLLVGIAAAYRISNIKRIPLVNEFARSFYYIEANYKTLVEMASDAIISVDNKGSILSWNPAAARIFGYAELEAVGANLIGFIFSGEAALLINNELQKLARAKGQAAKSGHKLETIARRKPWEDFPVEVSMAVKKVSGEWLGTFIIRDITDRKRSEEAILRSKLLLQSVIDSTPDWMYVKDFQHKFLLVNKSFAEAQNLAPQDMIGRADTDFFSEELCLGNPDKGIRGFHADDNQAFQGQMVHNPRNMVTWADGSLHIYDTYKIPLTDQSGNIYAILVYSRDITQQRKAEDEREASFNTLQKTLHDVINTMAKIVEMRDPYTSGHQGRVADLAGAIAREMKLDDSRIEHLMMAASIHDVGKMYVPADILSKPGRLSDIEWDMIKTHVQGSYEILKDLEFSQPITLMALQHHERLDGSGYPNGLKGEETILEAKILAVADVVEAMSSHRPYRPALGLDKALEEISSNKGVLYDPGIVDICLKLFKEQGYKFE